MLYTTCICFCMIIIVKVKKKKNECELTVIVDSTHTHTSINCFSSYISSSVYRNKFLLRFPNAIQCKQFLFGYIIREFLHRSKDPYEFDGSKRYDLSNGMASLSNQCSIFCSVYHFTFSTTILSQCIWYDAIDFGKLCSCKYIPRYNRQSSIVNGNSKLVISSN